MTIYPRFQASTRSFIPLATYCRETAVERMPHFRMLGFGRHLPRLARNCSTQRPWVCTNFLGQAHIKPRHPRGQPGLIWCRLHSRAQCSAMPTKTGLANHMCREQLSRPPLVPVGTEARRMSHGQSHPAVSSCLHQSEEMQTSRQQNRQGQVTVAVLCCRFDYFSVTFSCTCSLLQTRTHMEEEFPTQCNKEMGLESCSIL